MKKKGIAIVLAMLLALCAGVGATLAYIFVQTEEVVNTFSYGDINIELWEHKYENGALTAAEVKLNNTYKVIPGVTEDKDPFVRVKSGSEKCYVYVAVTNSVKLSDGTVVAALDIDTMDWKQVEAKDDTILYRYKEVVDASAEDKVLPVFTKVTYDATKITKANISQVSNDTIKIVAFAYQQATVTQDAADTAVTALAFTTP